MSEVTLKVDMMCQGCVGAVQRVLGKLEGVRDVAIDLEQKKVVVKTDPSLDPQTVLQAVAKTGKATEFWPA